MSLISSNRSTSDEDEGIPPSPSPPIENQLLHNEHLQQVDTIEASMANEWTKQVDEAELMRLVRDEALKLPDMNLALTGLAGRFPKCDHINEFEENLRLGLDMVNDHDEARFSCGLWGLPPRAGRLRDLSRFDHEFFGFTQEEANYVDFQLRILYEVVYESLLDAGLNPANLRGSNTGVFFGLHCNEFENAMADDPAFKSHGYFAQFAVRVAQYFDFRGLTITFDAACASGFVGFHNAIQALNDGIIDQAIVCSSNIPIHPTGSFIFLQMQMLSPTGFSRFLDSRADGYVKSEACVSLVVQKKHLAKRNYCSIMASMTSVDGYKKEGITFPSDKSQEGLIRQSKALAGISTNHVQYLEAHGTGTPAGDPQEARAITSVYLPNGQADYRLTQKEATKVANKKQKVADVKRNDCAEQTISPEADNESIINEEEEGPQKEQQLQHRKVALKQMVTLDSEQRVIGPLLLGSVKTNMGHSEATSGLCALAKVALMFEYELIYKGLHYQQPNKIIPALVEGKIKFVTENLPLLAKIIPVSCYGFGGSNVHAIVRANDRPAIDGLRWTPGADYVNESNTWPDARMSLNCRLIVMFGRSESILNGFFDNLLDGDSYYTKNCLSDDYLALLDALNCDKIDRLMNYRGYMLVDRQNRIELTRAIKRCDIKPLDCRPESGINDLGRRKHLQEFQPRSCCLILPGVGCQWKGMAAGLRDFEPFWSTIVQLADLMDPDVDLVAVLTNGFGQLEEVNNPDFDSMSNTFVSIVAYEIALINMLKQKLKLNNLKWIVGHSLGEISCAYASGLFDEREALRVAYEMGKTLDNNRDLCQGKMVALEMSQIEAKKHLKEFQNTILRQGNSLDASTLRICCINGPESVTISGSSLEVDNFLAKQKLANQSILINGSFALHNEAIMTEEIQLKLRESLERVLLPLTDYDRTKTNWISSIAKLGTENEAADLSQANLTYFIRMLCSQVDFLSSLEELQSDSILIEAGPSNLFESQVMLMRREPTDSLETKSKTRNKPKFEAKFQHVKTMCRNVEPKDQLKRLLISLGELYQAGATFNLGHMYHGNQLASLFPVRRQTPSLSSLFKWEHTNELFVPRYPLQFSKSSAKCEMPVDIVQDRDKYLTGHCVEGRILYPATGYLLLIWRVFSFTKRKIYDACFQEVEKELVPVEFLNVRLLRAIILGNRVAQIYIQLEEATGKFEIKEGGSVVVEGYVRSPIEQPNGLLYDQIKTNIQQENLELNMTSDDIYKQFRVSGYDYGETFRNIESCSFDGRYCRVKFNGHFIAFTDSILQSIFLAVAEYAPSGGLFLPTRFDYVRFQPELILKKIHEANMAFDLSEKSLNTKTKREAMTKMMQRAGALNEDRNNPIDSSDNNNDPNDTTAPDGEQANVEEEHPQAECIFDTYCDPITGIIITDGIELRGIKATPAPRRSDMNEVLLESYQFVEDFEMPVEDEHLTSFNAVQRPYVQICNSMSLDLLAKLMPEVDKQMFVNIDQQVSKQMVEIYKKRQLTCIYSDFQATSMANEADSTQKQSSEELSTKGQQKQQYDIKKNGSRTLISVLDQLLDTTELIEEPAKVVEKIRTLLEENRLHLMKDLIQSPWTSERYLRPIIETVIENCCLKKMKLRTIEINHGDELMRVPMQTIMSQVEPSLSLDYSIAHPDPNRIKGGVGNAGGKDSSNPIKTFILKRDADGLIDLGQLFNENHLKNLDFIVYKDTSCYSDFYDAFLAEKQMDLGPIISAINGALRFGGYALIIMRQKLTLAERILALAQNDNEILSLNEWPVVSTKLDQINSVLESRCELLIEEAQKANNKMLCTAKKSDTNGCLVLLFRCSTNHQLGQQLEQQQQRQQQQNSHAGGEVKQLEQQLETQEAQPLMLRIRHDDLTWLDELKANFHQPDEVSSADQGDKTQQPERDNLTNEEQAETRNNEAGTNNQRARLEPRLVWLCAVASKENPINGLIGYMQALRRELGSSKLRCFYDEFTFKQTNEPISMDQIEQSASFKLAKERDQLWNCVNHLGRLGSFRHFIINDFMSHESCLCSNQFADSLPLESDGSDTSQQHVVDEENKQHDHHQALVEHKPLGAYVNTATRGDLSSFVWYEVPLKYHHEQLVNNSNVATSTSDQLVKVAYSALNFRDIMLATGRLPLDAIPIRLAMADCLLGLEFSGHELVSGKRVMGMVYGRGLATHVVCPNNTSIKLEIPNWISLEEAATIPVVYATAVMALIYRGRMRSGESILIHAGSGGVGQAAIRLAGHFGLEIFTTVGSDEKKQFLLEEFGQYLDADHVFSSRDCHFEQAIMDSTRGVGVDLVLNSLADDKLQASLRCLKAGGRFLEIGKYDMSVDSRLELLEFAENKTIHGILLDKLFDVDDIGLAFQQQLKCVLETLKQGLQEGFVKPIKYKVFKRFQVEEAFRYMATGKHVGKILIEINNAKEIDTTPGKLEALLDIKCVPKFQLSGRKSYIVTGGLGGFGLELCKWLVNQGARHLVITSRTGLRTGYQRAVLRRLEQISGCKLIIVTESIADTTRRSGVEKLCQLSAELAPSGQIGGIFHLAMVLKDCLIENMSCNDFELVCRPKVETCLHLDALTRPATIGKKNNYYQVDHFVAFSSIVCGKGNTGQSNYAYANSCLERICEQRRRLGQHGLAIQWGAIGDVGIAFENLGGNDVIIGGTIPQRMPSCLSTLGRLLCSPFTICLSVLPVNRSTDGQGERGNLVDAIMHVLGIKDTSKVSDDSTLGDLGLDSLMAVEIRQYIEREYDITLNIQEIRSLTIAKIREINDKEKPAAGQKQAFNASASPEATNKSGDTKGPRQVSSYGIKQKAEDADRAIKCTDDTNGQKAMDKTTPSKQNDNKFKSSNNNKTSNQADRLQTLINERLEKGIAPIEAMLSESQIATMKPHLILPEEDFCWLNYGSKEKFFASLETSSDTNRRPIFFLPPIYGHFRQLELICENISRPCIGLNWTQKLATVNTIQEVVDCYLNLLRQTDWKTEFGCSAEQLCDTNDGQNPFDERQSVDLVGYSFGATIAFELMLSLYNNGKEFKLRTANKLAPGQLILLDGSPKQIELGSKFLSGLTSKRPRGVNEIMDELLMIYILAHTRHISKKKELGSDYLALQRELKATKEEKKIQLASSKLVNWLDDQAIVDGIRSSSSGGSSKMHPVLPSITSVDGKAELQIKITYAMEAFCRRYELITNYKATLTCLPSDCTLIRAEKLYLNEQAAKNNANNNYNNDDGDGTNEPDDQIGNSSRGFVHSSTNYDEDLNLSSVVHGKVNLYVMRGDHETFLNINHITIGNIIAKLCHCNLIGGVNSNGH